MSDFKRVFINIERRLKGLVGKVRLKDYGEDAINRIQKRTRLGYGVVDGERGNPRYKLPKLSEIYKEQRRKSLKRKLSSTTKPSKSNLTLTGQLLESLRSRIVGKKIILSLSENRDDGVKNKDIVKGQADQKRYFFELTDKEVKGLRNQLKKDLIKLLRKK